MIIFTEKQQKVFDAAKNKLKDESWYSGICCDEFPEDEEIDKDFDEAVNSVCFLTAFYDDPNFMRGN